jgi:hypothetical protein
MPSALIEKVSQMRTTLLLVPASAILFFGCSSAPPPPPFKPIATVKELMNSVIDPSADLIWNAVATIQTPTGTEERQPHTTEEWTKVQEGATMVAESGNLLMMVPRAKDGDVWMKMAQGLIDAGVEARKAADAKDADAVFNAGANIYYACSNCHVRYIDEIKNAYPNGPPDVTK